MTADTHSIQARRQQWLAVLARASRAELEQACSTLPAGEVHDIRAPEAGVLMLRGRVGGSGDAFNFGEATLTRCAVRRGDRLGVGYTLGRDNAKARLIALLDAALQDEALNARLMAEVVEPLRVAQARAAESRSRAAASSRVDFFAMVRGETA